MMAILNTYCGLSIGERDDNFPRLDVYDSISLLWNVQPGLDVNLPSCSSWISFQMPAADMVKLAEYTDVTSESLYKTFLSSSHHSINVHFTPYNVQD